MRKEKRERNVPNDKWPKEGQAKQAHIVLSEKGGLIKEKMAAGDENG